MEAAPGSVQEKETIMKRCCTCKETKPLDEFYRNKSTKDGYQSSCKPCQLGHANAWKKANRERDNARRHQYYLENREAESERKRKWRQAKNLQRAES